MSMFMSSPCGRIDRDRLATSTIQAWVGCSVAIGPHKALGRLPSHETPQRPRRCNLGPAGAQGDAGVARKRPKGLLPIFGACIACAVSGRREHVPTAEEYPD